MTSLSFELLEHRQLLSFSHSDQSSTPDTNSNEHSATADKTLVFALSLLSCAIITEIAVIAVNRESFAERALMPNDTPLRSYQPFTFFSCGASSFYASYSDHSNYLKGLTMLISVGVNTAVDLCTTYCSRFM